MSKDKTPTRAQAKKGGNVTRAEQEARLTRAVELLSLYKTAKAEEILMREYNFSRRSARSLTHNAHKHFAERYTKEREHHEAILFDRLETTITSLPLGSAVRLQAIMTEVKIMGLAAPTQSEIKVTQPPFDPNATDKLHNPEVRRLAMQLEEAMEGGKNGDTTDVAAIDAGTPCNPWLAVSETHPDDPAIIPGHALFPRS